MELGGHIEKVIIPLPHKLSKTIWGFTVAAESECWAGGYFPPPVLCSVGKKKVCKCSEKSSEIIAGRLLPLPPSWSRHYLCVYVYYIYVCVYVLYIIYITYTYISKFSKVTILRRRVYWQPTQDNTDFSGRAKILIPIYLIPRCIGFVLI